MNCAIDIGNTRIKVGFFEGEKLLEKTIVDNLRGLYTLLHGKEAQEFIVSSVVDKSAEIALPPNAIFLSHQTDLPITNAYATPETLGLDRIALAVAGHARHPQNDVLIIDCGTTVTYDFINKTGEYQGGAISPGLKMRAKALNSFTARLPVVTTTKTPDLIGKDTESSISSGVFNGLVMEISGFIHEYSLISDNLAVILSGGDAKTLSKALSQDVLVVEDLVLEGLNRILIYNVDQR